MTYEQRDHSQKYPSLELNRLRALGQKQLFLTPHDHNYRPSNKSEGWQVALHNIFETLL